MDEPKGFDLHIPSAIVEALRLPESEARVAVRQELAVALYRQGLLSFGKARELTGLGKDAYGQLLGARGVLRHYGEVEANEDLAYGRGEA